MHKVFLLLGRNFLSAYFNFLTSYNFSSNKCRPKLEKYTNMQNVDPRTYFQQIKKFHWWIKLWRWGTRWVSFRGIPMWCHWSLDQSNYLPDVYVLQRKHNEEEVYLSAEIKTYFGIVNSVWKIDMKDPQVDPKSPTSLQARPTSENKLSEGKNFHFDFFFPSIESDKACIVSWEWYTALPSAIKIYGHDVPLCMCDMIYYDAWIVLCLII